MFKDREFLVKEKNHHNSNNSGVGEVQDDCQSHRDTMCRAIDQKGGHAHANGSQDHQIQSAFHLTFRDSCLIRVSKKASTVRMSWE